MKHFRKASAWDINNRFAVLSPATYDAKGRTVQAVLSVGAAVKRYYGTEILLIEAGAVNLERLGSCGVPVIDSHNVFGIDGVFGRVERAWCDGGKLQGLLLFDDSEAGRKAEGLVARGMVRSVSIGYRVDEWKITDADGKVIDPEKERMQWDAEYTFTATRWTLLEVSLVSVPADPDALIRSHTADPGGTIGVAGAAEILARMRLREREAARSYVALRSSPAESHDSNGMPYGMPYGLPRRRRYPGGQRPH